MRPRPFGRYILVDKIASGGMGEVYAAIATGLPGFAKPCALKKIRRGLASANDFSKRFRDEGRLVVSMSHPNVVNVYEIGEVRSELFMAMELVEGRDLGQFLTLCYRNRRMLGLPAVLYIVREILAALEYCHRHTDEAGSELQLVHRDVSPANVLLSFDGHVKLADFGLAQSTIKQVKTQPHLVLGKPGYMAPERLYGAAVDQRADLFGVGVLLFELLTCRRFASGREPAEFMREMIQRSRMDLTSMRSDLPPSVNKLFHKAVSIEPAGRFSCAAEFHDAVQKTLAAVAPSYGARQLSMAVMHKLFQPQQERQRLLSLIRSIDIERLQAEEQGSQRRELESRRSELRFDGEMGAIKTLIDDPFDGTTEPLRIELNEADILEVREASNNFNERTKTSSAPFAACRRSSAVNRKRATRTTIDLPPARRGAPPRPVNTETFPRHRPRRRDPAA